MPIMFPLPSNFCTAAKAVTYTAWHDGTTVASISNGTPILGEDSHLAIVDAF